MEPNLPRARTPAGDARASEGQGSIVCDSQGPPRPLACVLGDIDLERALRLADLPCAVVSPRGDPTWFSRSTRSRLEFGADPLTWPALLAELRSLGAQQPARPVLFYQADSHLAFVSRYLDELVSHFRFVIPPPQLVEDLVDKARWQALATRLGLPVPAARRLSPADPGPAAAAELRFPLVLKPLRRASLARTGFDGKAFFVSDRTALERLWPDLARAGVDLLAQELIEGPEDRIESYHAYVGAAGQPVAGFTGRKLRTYPLRFGETTALTTTDAPDVARLGREVLDAVGLRGVAKVDFKRASDGRLWLLEVNPRFTLWLHVGAVAGLNIPALVYADLTGARRPTATAARSGVTWCNPIEDRWARKAAGMSTLRWLRWVMRCDAKSGLARDDPMPFVRGLVLSRIRERARWLPGAGALRNT